MKDRDSTTRSRELGAELRDVREKRGFTATKLAELLGWSQGRISRMESGKRGMSEVDVATFLAYCGITGAELNRLLALCEDVFATTRMQRHGEHLPDELRSLVIQESTAEAITTYEPLVIEGLLQTESYACELFRWAQGDLTDAAKLRIQARMDRQNILKRRWPPEATFFIPERVLRTTVGNARVMNEQLLHLALVSARPRCRVRVIPDSAGPHGALGGPFRLMEYRGNRPAIYVENQTASLFLEEPGDVAIYRTMLARIDEIALDGGQSREFLATLASEYDQPEDGDDEA